MDEKLKSCPHCGSEGREASLAEWPYLSKVVLCRECGAKGPQALDSKSARFAWNQRLGTVHPAMPTEEMNPCPYCAGEDLVQGDSGIGNEPDTTQQSYFVACPHCKGRGPHTGEKQAAIIRWNERVDG